MKKKTIFLDRDGVINHRVMNGYVQSVEDFHLLDGAPEAIVTLSKAGYRLVVLTNQRGIALGYYTIEDLNEIHRTLSEKISSLGGTLVEFFFCPHDRNEGCTCRKPEPGMIDLANQIQPVDWEKSWLIGDSDTDLLAGKARHLKVIKIGKEEKVKPFATVSSLRDAVSIILAKR